MGAFGFKHPLILFLTFSDRLCIATRHRDKYEKLCSFVFENITATVEDGVMYL